MKTFLTAFVGTLAVVAFTLGATGQTVGGIVSRFVYVSEDATPIYDCRYSGNKECGPNPTWRLIGYW